MKQFCALLLTLAFIQTSFGQLSGPLSGTLGPGEFHVIDTIYVNTGDSLILLPGTTFNFDGPYPFWIYGILLAEGTEGDSIIFTTDTIANPDRWRGLRFSGSYCSARLSYCLIEKGLATDDEPHGPKRYGGGVWCAGVSSLVFENCVIRGNMAASRGGGMYCYNCSPIFTNCTISGNEAGTWCGGGVFCTEADPTFTDCIISGNMSGDDGGGVELYGYSIVTLTNCEIHDNIAGGWGGGLNSAGSGLTLINSTVHHNSASSGGGIAGYESWLTITDCEISGNTAHGYGGGVRGYDAYESRFTNCTIDDNVAGSRGGGVYCSFSAFNFTRCTLSGNSAQECGGGVSCEWTSAVFNSTIIAFSDGFGLYFDRNCENSQFNYCDVFGNSGGNIAFLDDDPSHAPPNIGVLSTTNANDDSCDQYSNIFLAPMFVDTSTGDYHLLAASPCIDAGDPNISYDPDGSISDIGAFYYHQSNAEPSAATLPTVHQLHPNWPNPFNPTTTIHYDVAQNSRVRLTIYNLLGQEIAQLIDKQLSPGSYRVTWNATNLPSGLYLCQMEADGFVQTRKLVLMK